MKDLISSATVLAFYVLGFGGMGYGVYHAFDRHGIGAGGLSVVVFPVSWYYAAEGLIWHDDYSGMDWDRRLRNDVEAVAALLGGRAQIEPAQVPEFNRAVEAFSDEIAAYPSEQLNHLASFGALYIAYTESLANDLSDSFDAIAFGVSSTFTQSPGTLALETQLLEYDGAENFVSQVRQQLAAVSGQLQGELSNLTSEDANRITGFMETRIENDMTVMRQAYEALFGIPANNVVR